MPWQSSFKGHSTPGKIPLNLGFFEVNIHGHAAGAPSELFGCENFGNAKKVRKYGRYQDLEKLPWQGYNF